MTTAHRTSVMLPLLALLGGVSCVAALMVGATAHSPSAVFRALLNPDSAESAIISGLRLPRVLLAFVVGGSLAVAGATLQAVIRNPLAEPWLLGLSGGASLGAIIGILIGLPPGWSVAGAATVGALAAIALVYRISRVADRRLDPSVLLLAGVVVGAFAGALSTAILMVADPFAFRSAATWLFGGFAGAGWSSLVQFGPIALISLALIGLLARSLDLLALGDETAMSLGADVERTQRVAILATAVLTAGAVSVSGVIGFVGLVVPHALRWLIGPIHRSLLPAAFMAGGIFTVLADAIARTIMAPAELPVGVVTALVGVPVFAMLLRRSSS